MAAAEAGAGVVTERELQAGVVELARLLGWRVAHFRPARVRRGGRDTYETPVAADGKGFPDLVLVRGGHLLFVELKTDTGRLSPEQQDWLLLLTRAGARTFVWRPGHWLAGEVEKTLRAGGNTVGEAAA